MSASRPSPTPTEAAPGGAVAAMGGAAGHALRCALLVLVCLFAFVPGIAQLPPTDRDESRFVQASRQMAETGDYVDIRFQDQTRYLKPVGIYWLQNLAVAAQGDGADAPIWAFRSVSVAAAILAVLATYWAGLRLFGPQAALLAALGLAGIVMLNFEARIAKTDATLLAASVAVQAALAHIYLGARQGRAVPALAPWVFWIAMSVGLLVKGPITPALALATIAALSLYDRDWRWLSGLRPLRGLALTALLVAPWPIAITLESGATFWREALGRDMFAKITSGQESHGFPPGYYAVTFVVFMWPFALETLRAGLKGLNRMAGDPRIAFCVAWYVPFWLVFELIPTKLPHYVLPAYPAILVLMGWALTEPGAADTPLRRWQVWLMRAAVFGWGLITVGLAAIAAGLLPFVTGTWSLWGLLAAALALLAGWLGSGFRPPLPPLPRILAATLSAGALFGLLTQQILPAARPLWLSTTIAEAFEANRPCPDSVLASAGFSEPSLVVLAGTPTRLTGAQGAADHLAADPQCAVAVVLDSYLADFHAALPGGEAAVERLATISALDYTKGVAREMVMVRLAPPAE